MARLYTKKGNYYARFHDPAKTPARKLIPLRTRDEAAALAALKRLEVHYAEGRFDPWAPPVRPEKQPAEQPDRTPLGISAAVASFLEAKSHCAPSTLRLYRTVLEGFCDHAGIKHVRGITPTDLRGFLASRDLNDSGRETYHVRLKAFFRWCQREGLAEAAVTDRVQVQRAPKVFPYWLRRDEFERLLAVMRQAAREAHEKEVDWLIPLVTVAAYTGLRLGELIALRWGDVDLERRRLYVRNGTGRRTKNRRDRVVPIAQPALEVFRGQRPGEGTTIVFTGAKGGKVNPEYASKSFLRYRRRAGLPKEIHFHSLRHTCASWLVQGGVSLARVKEILGHASIETTMRYAHLAPSTALDEVDRVFGNS